MLVRFPFREAATGSGRHRQPSPHRGREAQSFLPSAENQATDAGRAIRSSVHRTSERHTLKTVTATNSQRAVRLTLLRLNYQSPDGHLEMSLAFTIFASEAEVASWGFCKQKHRSTPIGALAPTRLPVASGQREGPPRKVSGARLRRRNLYALPARGKPPPEISEPPRGPRLCRPGRFLDLAVKAESRISAQRKVSPVNDERRKNERHGKNSAKRSERRTSKNQRRKQVGQNCQLPGGCFDPHGH